MPFCCVLLQCFVSVFSPCVLSLCLVLVCCRCVMPLCLVLVSLPFVLSMCVELSSCPSVMVANGRDPNANGGVDGDARGEGDLRNPPPAPDDDGRVAGGPLTGAELKKLWKEAAAKEKADRKVLKEASDLKQKRLREARAELKDAIQAVRKKVKLTPKDQDHMSMEPNDYDSSCSDQSSKEEGELTGKSVRKRLTQLEKWANGNKSMRERKQVSVHTTGACRHVG